MKVVCIGAGRIVKWFLDDIKNTKYNKKIIPYGIYNRTKQKAVNYAKEYRMEKIYNNIEEIINDKDNYDIVYIGSSHLTHYEYSKKLLENKINVYCEKPITINYKQAEELYSIAKKNNVLMFDGIKTGFSKAYLAMKEDIKNNIIGDLNYVNISFAKVSTSNKVPNPTKDDKEFVGSHLANGMYPLFIALDILGSAKTIAHMNNKYNNENKEIATSVFNIRHQNNTISTLLDSNSLTSDLSAMILGTKGYIKLGGNLNKYYKNYCKDTCHMAYTYEVYDLQNKLIKKVDKSFKTEGEGLCLVIDHIYELINKKVIESNIVSKELSLQIIKILELTNNTNDNEIIKL